MPIAPALTRAQAVIANNKYFALATVDDRGPWVAALGYTFVQPNALCFFSEASSRHGAALREGGHVAGVVFDSRCEPADVESVQFSGRGEVVRDRDSIAEVLRLSAQRAGDPPPSDDVIDEHVSRTTTLLYRIVIEDAYVLDQNLYEAEGIDAREPVRIEDVFAGLG